MARSIVCSCADGVVLLGHSMMSLVIFLCKFSLLHIFATAALHEGISQENQPLTGAVKSTNSWAVEVEGGLEKANTIARRHGLINLGQV